MGDNITAPEIENDTTVESKDSILNSVKKQLGIMEEDASFDQDILFSINTALFVLYQLGIGPKKPFSIEGPEETFSSFLGDNSLLKGPVGKYLYYRTKLGFDPSSSSTVNGVIEQKIKELEWRLQAMEYEPFASEMKEGEISK